MAELGAHVVKRYEHELGDLHSRLVQMGGMVETQLATAARAVLESDGEAAKAAIGQDQAVDARPKVVHQCTPTPQRDRSAKAAANENRIKLSLVRPISAQTGEVRAG